MKKLPVVRIDKPCHESWSAMTQAEKGRFCEACTKVVMDFSEMTDSQIVEYFKHAKAPTCGRFRKGQLERPLQSAVVSKGNLWQKAAVVVALLSVQTPKLPAQQDENGQSISRRFGDKLLKNQLGGFVTDAATGSPIAGMEVSIPGENKKAITDEWGYFMLDTDLSDTNRVLILEFEKAGYVPVRFESAVNLLPESMKLSIQMDEMVKPASATVVTEANEEHMVMGDTTYYYDPQRVSNIELSVLTADSQMQKEALVEIWNGESLVTRVRTDCDGRAYFGELTPGVNYTIRVSAHFYETQQIMVETMAGKTRKVTMVMDSERLIMGKPRMIKCK